MRTLAERIAQVRERMRRAASLAGRSEHAVRLIAVTKTVPASRILEALACGVTSLGENRVQEALVKMDAVPDSAEWHFLGHLQTNKIKKTAGRFRMIHSVDSVPVAREIGRYAVEAGGDQEVLVQVNVSKEAAKHGFSVEEAPHAVDRIAEIPGIRVRGLMTIPRPTENPEESRPAFRMLADLAREIRRRSPAGETFTELSMGMSDDFETAIGEGATMVRIGRAIFGERAERNDDGPKRG